VVPFRKRKRAARAVLLADKTIPRPNELPLAANVGWDKLGHETQKRTEGAPLLAPAVGLEPSWDHPGSHDSVAITSKGVDEETVLKRGECALRIHS
jgi:hypothetical protein